MPRIQDHPQKNLCKAGVRYAVLCIAWLRHLVRPVQAVDEQVAHGLRRPRLSMYCEPVGPRAPAVQRGCCGCGGAVSCCCCCGVCVVDVTEVLPFWPGPPTYGAALAILSRLTE